jgi:hypothetical protein
MLQRNKPHPPSGNLCTTKCIFSTVIEFFKDIILLKCRQIQQVCKLSVRVNMSVIDSIYVLHRWLELFCLARESCHITGNNHLLLDSVSPNHFTFFKLNYPIFPSIMRALSVQKRSVNEKKR